MGRVDSKKKVLMVSCDTLENGGVQNVIMGIVRELCKQYTFDIILFSDEEGYYEKEFLSYGGKIFRIPHRNGKSCVLNRADLYIRWIKNYSTVKKIIREHGPYAAVHCQNDLESGYILKAAEKCGVPVRISQVQRVVERFPGVRALAQMLWVDQVRKYGNCLIACSEEACKAFFGCNVKWKCLPNPYDTNVYHNDNVELENSYPLNIVQIGSYSGNKNQLFSIEVIGKINEKFSGAKLFLVGFENEEGILDKLRKRSVDLGVSENVIFLPHDADKVSLLREAAYFFFPSLHEGFGIVLLEAQAMGVRCFASDTVPCQADCGGVTYLPLSLGPKHWAKCILEDYQLTKGAHGEFDCSKFTSKNIAVQFAEIYEGKF